MTMGGSCFSGSGGGGGRSTCSLAWGGLDSGGGGGRDGGGGSCCLETCWRGEGCGCRMGGADAAALGVTGAAGD